MNHGPRKERPSSTHILMMRPAPVNRGVVQTLRPRRPNFQKFFVFSSLRASLTAHTERPIKGGTERPIPPRTKFSKIFRLFELLMRDERRTRHKPPHSVAKLSLRYYFCHIVWLPRRLVRLSFWRQTWETLATPTHSHI